MKEKIKTELTKSKNQLILLYVIQVVLLTAAFITYKQVVLSGHWANFTYNATASIYTEYETKKKFEGAYWQIEIAIGFIENIFQNEQISYSPVQMCTNESCFEMRSQDPDLDAQYDEINAYEGAISNITHDSVFGNIGLLLWHFKYSRARNIDSYEIILQSSRDEFNMKLHIPIQKNPKNHYYNLTKLQDCFFDPSNIIIAKSFNFTKGSQTLSGQVSTKINIQKLKSQLSNFKVKIFQKHTGNIYIDTLDPNNAFSTKQISFNIGTITIDMIIMQEHQITQIKYFTPVYIISLLILFSLIPMVQHINLFFKKYINPTNSINNILKQKLNYSFNNSENKKHNLIGINQELNQLCERCQELPNYNIKKQEFTKKNPIEEQFKFLFKLNEVSDKFKSKIRLVDQSTIYNNRFIIKINNDFEYEKGILKSLMEIMDQKNFFKLAYLAVCQKRQYQYLKLSNDILSKHCLRKQQKQIFSHFYFRFHSPSLLTLRSKINGDSDFYSDMNIGDNLLYFDGLYLSSKQLNQRSNFFKTYYQKAFFQRIRNIILSKYLLFIKQQDKSLKHLKYQLCLQPRITQIQQQVDNLRYMMSRKHFTSDHSLL